MEPQNPQDADLAAVRGPYRAAFIRQCDLPALLRGVRDGVPRAIQVAHLIEGVVAMVSTVAERGATSVCAGCDTDIADMGEVAAILVAIPEPGGGTPAALGVCEDCAAGSIQRILERIWPATRQMHGVAGRA